jgi:aromatic ring-opening dioxygenase catalytic subunit (LigB family)
VSLVFAGVCSHAPGITGRKDRADPKLRDAFYASYERMRQALEAQRPDALIVVAAEHFANFFMNNMPAICVGMGDAYEGPIEDEAWLGIRRSRVPGLADLSRRLIEDVMQDVELAYAQEWQFDHGIMVPLSFLTPRYDLPVIPVNINCQGPPLIPLHRCYEFGRALRRACDRAPERIALIGTGGISHWPATPDSGRINEPWDRAFLERFLGNEREQLLAYRDADTWREAGQGGFEIRTFIAVAGATEGCTGELWFYAPIPIFAVGCTIAVMNLGKTV